VPNSRPTSDKSASKTSGGSKIKPGTPLYTGEITRSVEDVLSISDNCLASLTKLDESLQAQIATQQAIINQDTTDLTTLSGSLVTAQNNGNQLVERDLSAKVTGKKEDLKTFQEYSKSLSQAESYVATLISQVTATRNAAYAQATAAPAAQDTSSIVTDVFQTIQQNFLKFLLFSLIIGAIFDPIQRGLLSFVGPRRNVFSVFNKVYGQQGDGEIRYGDRRLPPWTHETGDTKYLPDLDLPTNKAKAREEEKKQDLKGLRYSPADFAYRRNMNIYDQNYAIGAGYITQSEFDGIYNEFYTQSQITTGLILPMLILSICIGVRFICCATHSPVGSSSWWLLGAVGGAMYIGLLLGWLLSHLISFLGSSAYGKAANAFGFSEGHLGLKILFAAVFLVISYFVYWANDDVLGFDVLPIIALPCSLLLPLWITGLDRLHKFYSELQARIAGNILRLQESTQQKMVDLINQSDSRASLQDNLAMAKENTDQLLAFLEQLEQYDTAATPGQSPTPPSAAPSGSPGGSPGPTPGESA
jgi:hypothetical protein